MTDGDGTFSISLYKNHKCGLTFKISQSKVNAKLIYYIKENLNCGKVEIFEDEVIFRIRDLLLLKNIILPIFDRNMLRSKKYYDYLKFKKVLNILINNPLGINRDNLILDIINQKEESMKNLSVYIINDKEQLSPIWLTPKVLNNIENFDFEYYNNILTKPWLIGFIEAGGSFYITKKDINRYSHGFGITQKKDKIILEGIKKILHIPSKVKNNTAGNFWSLDNTNNLVNFNFKDYFDGQFKGIKSVQFSIWSRTLIKSKNIKEPVERKEYLKNIQLKLQKLVVNNK